MKEKNRILGDEVDGNEDEQREKLRDIANKIDTDQDGKISRDEMRIYVEQRVKFVLFYISKKKTIFVSL
jgi:Ca2+-binding EF-hand superfamily protein